MKKLFLILKVFFLISCSIESKQKDTNLTQRDFFAFNQEGKNLGNVLEFNNKFINLLSNNKYFYSLSFFNKDMAIIELDEKTRIVSNLESAQTINELIFITPMNQYKSKTFEYLKFKEKDFGFCNSSSSSFPIINPNITYYEYPTTTNTILGGFEILNFNKPLSPLELAQLSGYFLLDYKECTPEEALGFSLPIELPIEIKDSNGNLIVTYPLSIDDSKKLQKLNLLK